MKICIYTLTFLATTGSIAFGAADDCTAAKKSMTQILETFTSVSHDIFRDRNEVKAELGVTRVPVSRIDHWKTDLQSALTALDKFSTIKSKPILKWSPPVMPLLKSDVPKLLGEACPVKKGGLCKLENKVLHDQINVFWATVIPLIDELQYSIDAASSNDQKFIKGFHDELVAEEDSLRKSVDSTDADKNKTIDLMNKDCLP